MRPGPCHHRRPIGCGRFGPRGREGGGALGVGTNVLLAISVGCGLGGGGGSVQPSPSCNGGSPVVAIMDFTANLCLWSTAKD